jgi:hypothetical protein
MNGLVSQQPISMPYPQSFFPPPTTDVYPNEQFYIPKNGQQLDPKSSVRAIGKMTYEGDMLSNRNQ